jgi:L-ascorbate metabolism protein UlaG (beta-lactamase superfamily)
MAQRLHLSEHHRNGRYFNPGAQRQRFTQFVRWITSRKGGSWRKYIPGIPGPKPPVRVDGHELRATFVNHSTVLLQTEGYNFLTDPVWSQRVSPVTFLGPERHRNPGIEFEDLPPIDCILISHNHYDHLDVPTLRRLVTRHSSAIFCPLGVARLLRRIGFHDVHELDWWDSESWRNLRIHCVPAQHFSSRTPFDRNRTLWCGWTIEAAAGNIYFAGDTGFGDLFPAIQNRFGAFRLALLPIGAYEPEWFMGPIHMTPEQAVTAHSLLKASTSIAIHFGTFSLADDSETEPIRRLQTALKEHNFLDHFWILEEGEGRDIPTAFAQ